MFPSNLTFTQKINLLPNIRKTMNCKKESIHQITELIELINGYLSNKQKILIVLDIDDTIIRPTSTLGSDTWFRKCMQDKPHDIDSLIDKMYYVYSMLDFKLVEPNTQRLVDILGNDQIDYFCLTARNTLFTSHTVKHLTEAGVKDGFVRNNLLNVSDYLDIKLKDTVTDNMVSSYGIRYLDNLCHSSGNHKGEIITHILNDHYKSKDSGYDIVIFVDDSDRNVDKVYDSFLKEECFKNSLNYSIHYLFMEEHKNKYSVWEYINDSKKLDDLLEMKQIINKI